MKDIKNKYIADVDHCNEVLKKCEEELKLLKENTLLPSQSDLLQSMNQHFKNELETKYLIELTTALKNSLEEKVYTNVVITNGYEYVLIT